MFNPEKLLGGLVSGALGGALGGGRRGRGSLAMGALGVAVAAVEHLMEKQGQGQQAPSTPGGSAPPPPPGSTSKAPATPPPPPPGATPVPPPPIPAAAKSSADEYDAVLLIRAMIACAYADGQLDAAERVKILKRLETVDLDPEERAFMETELDQPRDAAELVAGVTNPKMAKQVYAVSLMAVTVDTEAEKTYLNQLAERLGLSQADRAKVHDIVKVPLF